jgi:hypothetical protein
MQEVQTGEATTYGIANDGTPITITGYVSFIFDSAKLAHMFDIDDVKNEIKFTAASIAADEHFDLDVAFTPTGATRAAAATNAAQTGQVVFPAPLAKVTFNHFKCAFFNADYQYRGGTAIDLSQGQPGKVSGMKLRRWADAAQNASLTTTVVG